MFDATLFRIRRVLLLAALSSLALVLSPPAARAFETPAKAAILIEAATGEVLYEKNADEPLPPASMSKLMTVLMAFERLRDGRLTLEHTLPISERAWRKGGSKMFVEVGKRVTVEDLLRGIIVQSGNDACIVLAEGLGGSEEKFSEQMTARAHELGLASTSLKNASGWPDPEHRMSMRDLATLAHMLIRDYPEYYTYFAEQEFEYNGIRQHNRNPLLRRGLGADGLKTGYTEEAGYSLTASAERDGRRLVLAMAGLETPGQRAREAERLLEHGFHDFATYALFKAGQPVEIADVWLGDIRTVPLVPEQDVLITLRRETRQALQVKLVYDGPIPAPVSNGAEIAYLEITAPGIEPRRVSLVAGHEVQAVNMLGRMSGALGYLIWGSS